MPAFVSRSTPTTHGTPTLGRVTLVHLTLRVHIVMFYRFTGLFRIGVLFSVPFLDPHSLLSPSPLIPANSPSTVSHTISRSMYGLDHTCRFYTDHKGRLRGTRQRPLVLVPKPRNQNCRGTPARISGLQVARYFDAQEISWGFTRGVAAGWYQQSGGQYIRSTISLSCV